MHPDPPHVGFPIEATDVAVGLVKAHQPVHERNFGERLVTDGIHRVVNNL